AAAALVHARLPVSSARGAAGAEAAGGARAQSGRGARRAALSPLAAAPEGAALSARLRRQDLQRRMKRAWAAALLLWAAAARAQSAAAPVSTTTGVAADRFTPAVVPGWFVGVEGAHVTAAGAVSWVAALDLGR